MLKQLKKEWIWVALILVVTFITFSPSLKNGFVNWDDDENITQNSNIQELNAANLKGIFSSTITGGYTPLTSLTFAIETHFFGMKPGVFHFNNILLHLLCTLLVFIFLRKLGSSLFITVVATLLFGIHPMRVESVTWITERKDVLYGFFYLLSLILYVTYYKSRKRVYYFLAIFSFVFALISKIQAVSLPLLLLLTDFYFEKRFTLKQVWDKVPFFVLSLITGIAGIFILGSQGTLHTDTSLPLVQRLFIGTYSFCAYVIKALWPYQLSAIYPVPQKLSVIFYLSPMMVIFLSGLIYRYGRHIKEVIFGTLFFLFNIVFMLQVLGAGQAFLADRFTYIAYIGLFFLIGWALEFLFSGKWKIYAVTGVVLYMGALGFVTWNRTQVWKNSNTLFTDVIKKYPNSAIAFNNLGLYFRDQNQNDKALAAYEKAIELKPEGYLSYTNRGEVWFDQGETEKALTDMNRAIQLNPDYSKALSNRGAIWGSKKEYAKALKDLDKSIAIDNRNLKAYINRSLVYFTMGKFDKAIQDVNSYVAMKADNADMFNLRALCYSRMNNNQEAFADFTRCIQLNPKSGAFYQNRSMVLYKMGDKPGALRDILKAQELGAKVDQGYVEMLKSR
jgi:tetratricopeptide (TPR) repeat protein